MYGNESVAPAAAGLVHHASFLLGDTLVTPATRELSGPLGACTLQPRVMQLLLELVDAEGAVVTRDVLALRCWNGRFVAEDSLNGAIADLRRAIRSVSGGGITIETVPRTGYRFIGPASRPPATDADVPTTESASHPPVPGGLSRRMLVGTGAAAVLVAAAGGYLLTRPRDRGVATLIERGSQALRDGLPDSYAQGIAALKEAVARDPNNAAAWGKLALAWRGDAENGGPDEVAGAVANAESAARRALALDPRQSDALTALAILVPAFGDWFAYEKRVRSVLAIDPANPDALGALATLLMSTGQVHATEQVLGPLVARDPLSANRQFRYVYCLWSLGRLAEMDRVADRALQLWPRHPAVWFARLWTLAFTGRAPVALAMLRDADARPAMPAPTLDGLMKSLAALSTGTRKEVTAAIALNVDAAARGPGNAVSAIMILSALGAADAAFEVAQGLLTRQGPLVVQQRHTSAQPSITDLHRPMTMVLWVPASLALRSHPGFMGLCGDIGLVDYWRRSGHWPDVAEIHLPAH